MRCFIIGPIGERHAPIGSPGRQIYEEALEILERVIVPACEAVGLEAIRADQIAAPGEITDQIFRHLRDDDVVIADVSNGNANVMYELGLRHTVNKLTVQIGEYGQVPFDIKNIRTIQFSRSRMGLIDARNELVSVLQVGLIEGNDPVAATRIWLETESSTSAVPLSVSDPAVVIEGSGEKIDEAGIMDQIARIEDSFPELTEIAGEIQDQILELGAITENANEQIQEANEKELSMKARLVIVGSFANAINDPAVRLEQSTERYADSMARLDEAIRGIAKFARGNPELASEESFQQFVSMVTVLASSSREAMEGVSSFGAAAEGLGGLSRLLKEPGRRIGNAVRRMAVATSAIDEWDRLLAPLASRES